MVDDVPVLHLAALVAEALALQALPLREGLLGDGVPLHQESVICLCILDKFEAKSASISKLATSKVTDLEMTPVKSDNSWRPARLNRLL